MTYLQSKLRKLLAGGMTLREIERELHGEVSHVSLSSYEKGAIPKHGKQLNVLANYFGCSIEDLVMPVFAAYHASEPEYHEDQPYAIQRINSQKLVKPHYKRVYALSKYHFLSTF